MKNNNMFNTVKKGIIRSAALLLLAGFCGNVSANLDDFLNSLKLDDQYSTRIAADDGNKIRISALNKVDDIKVGESIDPIFNPLLQKNYDLYMTLNFKEGDLEKHKTDYKKTLNYLDSLLGDKAVADYKPSDDGDAGYIKNIFQALYTNTTLLQRAVYFATKDKIDTLSVEDLASINNNIKGLSDNYEVATQALKDINNAINNHGVKIADLDNTNETLANVQAAVNALQTQIDNVETAKADAENNLNILLNWNDKDNNPVVDGFDGSALKALVEGLKAPKVLSEDEVKDYKIYQDLFSAYNQSREDLKEYDELIADLNQSLVKTTIQGVDVGVNKIKENLNIVLAELGKLTNQLEEAEKNKVDVNTLSQDDLKNNLYVQKMLDNVRKLTETLKNTVKASNSLKTDKDSLEAQLNEAKEAKETAENELSELNTKSSELINARNSEINKLKERIAELDSEIESKEKGIITLEKQNGLLISQVELLKINAIQLTDQLASMQNELQLAKDNTNKFENDDDELNDIEESATHLNESVENEEPEDENIGLSDGEESSTPLKESLKSEEPEEESTENISPSTNAEDEDLDNLLKEADFLIKETQKPSATSAASQPATKTAKTETQEKTSTFASSQSATKSAKAKTQEKTSTSASQSATKTAKTETKKQDVYKELFGDNVTPGNDDNPVLDGVNTEEWTYTEDI